MADGAITIQQVGDWRKEMGVSLKDALNASMSVMGRTGEQACRHALITMAKAAARITKSAKKNRKVMRDEHGKYVENYRKGHTEPQKLYEWMFGDKATDDKRIPGTWENAKDIGNRGMARRSWMWGMRKLGGRPKSKSLPGASKVYSIKKQNVGGYVKEVRLDYILKALPAGWASMVETSAGNKIMKQAQMKLANKWKREIASKRKVRERRVSEFFKAVASV